jgi:hypothetical protein
MPLAGEITVTFGTVPKTATPAKSRAVGLRHQGGADAAARAAPVLDDDRLAERCGERLQHDAPDGLERGPGFFVRWRRRCRVVSLRLEGS